MTTKMDLMSGRWFNPISHSLIPTANSMSFETMKGGFTGLPLAPHPGAFGVPRKFNVHEGVDLYCPEGTPVSTVEAGTVVAIIPFTGPQVDMPWWENTDAVLIEGASGVVLYGEIHPVCLTVGDVLEAGDFIGNVVRVLKIDKGRPMSMLHLELHVLGTTDAFEWKSWTEDSRPKSLLDPTPFLLQIAKAEYLLANGWTEAPGDYEQVWIAPRTCSPHTLAFPLDQAYELETVGEGLWVYAAQEALTEARREEDRLNSNSSGELLGVPPNY